MEYSKCIRINLDTFIECCRIGQWSYLNRIAFLTDPLQTNAPLWLDNPFLASAQIVVDSLLQRQRVESIQVHPVLMQEAQLLILMAS